MSDALSGQDKASWGNMGIHKYKCREIQIHRNTNTQKHKYTEIRNSFSPNWEGFLSDALSGQDKVSSGNMGIHKYKCTKIQIHKYKYTNTNTQKC